MDFYGIGISHHTAPVEVRERIAFDAAESRTMLGELASRNWQESVLLSTCNRTELYVVASASTSAPEALPALVVAFKKAEGVVDPQHFRFFRNGEAIKHMFKIAAGVDSMITGDIQILSQVKEGFNIAVEAGTIGPYLEKLKQSALRVGKRSRSETSISEGAVSVSYAAVELACKIFADLAKKSALLVGAGESGELTLKHLLGKGIGKLQIVNRTLEKAEQLAGSFGGMVVPYERMPEALRSVDIAICSVSSPSYIIGAELIQRIMKERQNNPLFLIDMGVPRNIDPGARKIENVFLYDIDSLGMIVDRNLIRRKEEIPKVTAIIREELAEFLRWQASLGVTPTIQSLTESWERIRRAEVEKNINRFQEKDRELVDVVTRRIVNKILHHPITTLRHGAENGHFGKKTLERVNVLRELFGIEKNLRDGDEE
jgi:glutamyl-tRNA reductase